jgi:hypothetical protein
MSTKENVVIRPLLLILFILLTLSQFGCATSSNHYPSLDIHCDMQRKKIALIPISNPLEVREIPCLSGSEKAAKTAGEFFALVGYVGATDPFALVLLPVVLPIAAGIHYTVEAIQATPKAVTDSIHQKITLALENYKPVMNLSERVLSEADKIDVLEIALFPEMAIEEAQEKPDYRNFANDEFDSVLEIDVRGVGFFSFKGKDPQLILVVVAEASIIEVGTLKEVHKQDFKLARLLKPYSEWADNGVETLKENLDEITNELAKKIVENFFIVADLGLPSGTSWGHGGTPGGSKYGCCWICPQYPQNNFSLSFKSNAVVLNYNEVYSLQPKLLWEAFPTSMQARKIYKRTEAAVSDVRYHLRIWEVSDEKRGVLVYERSGLINPLHTLEQPLSPNTRYFWSFRACFQIAGAYTCTPWAFSAIPWTRKNCSYSQIPAQNYYRFETPGENQNLAYFHEMAKYDDLKTITILENTYHIGDNTVKRFENPEPQGLIFESRFNIPDNNLYDISITILVSEMVPKYHKQFLKGYYKNTLVINDSKIDILNRHIKGVEDRSTIQSITIGLDNHAVKSGNNVIKIIAGVRHEKNNHDDFQLHGIILNYKNK